ncbi:hypothetical protein B0H19DRAFT_1026048, partial [Mycena capillaripes]
LCGAIERVTARSARTTVFYTWHYTSLSLSIHSPWNLPSIGPRSPRTPSQSATRAFRLFCAFPLRNTPLAPT